SGGVFRTSDGALVSPTAPSGRTAQFAYGFPALALSPDGTSAVFAELDRATLEAPSAPGLIAVLGGPPPARAGDERLTVNHLAMSADGSLLVVNVLGKWAFGLRLAPDLADSRVV